MLQAFLLAELLIEDHLEPRKEQSHGPYDRWKVGQRCDHSERRARSFYPRGLQVSPLDHAGWQTGTFWRGRIRGGSESLSSIRVAVLSVGTSNDHHAQVEAPGRDRLHVRRRSTENRRLGLLGGHRWFRAMRGRRVSPFSSLRRDGSEIHRQGHGADFVGPKASTNREQRIIGNYSHAQFRIQLIHRRQLRFLP